MHLAMEKKFGSGHQENCIDLCLSDPGPAPSSPPSINIFINTDLASDHLLQGTVMKIISEHSYTQLHRCSKILGRKPGNVSQPCIFIKGAKCGTDMVSHLFEFKRGWKWLKRISCALTGSSNHLLFYCNTDLGSDEHLCSSPKEP